MENFSSSGRSGDPSRNHSQLIFEHGVIYIRCMWTPEGEVGGMLITDQLPPA